jgi:glycosyltransferase involved in cell wall biosynthesis
MLIGIVGINQERKNWGFAAQLCEQIIAQWPDTKLWWHIDTAIRFVNIHALIADYHLADHVTVTTSPQTDTWLAEQYRMCTMTLLPSSEGFGYAWLESFACDVPCLHTDYAGGASMMRTCGLERYLVPTSGWRVEGQHNCVRPVLSLDMWLYKIGQVLEAKGLRASELSEAVSHLRWPNLAGRWLNWFHEGLA